MAKKLAMMKGVKKMMGNGTKMSKMDMMEKKMPTPASIKSGIMKKRAKALKKRK